METEKEIEKKGFDYFAFISYSHKDMKIAKRLKKRLQSYHLPTKLQKTYPTLPKKLGPIFIDEERLTGGVLQEAIRDNLDKSNYLILICSPNSAKSIYVNEEVKRFIETGRVDHIIPFIVDGVPHSGDELKECFPPALLELPLEQELLGIDLKKFGERDSFLRVIATMLELNLDNFISYEARERKRRAMIFTSIAASFVLIAGLLVWHNIDFFNATLYGVSSQHNLGVMYQEKQDYSKAMEWYQKAAAQGNANAQNNIGYMYLHGLGVKQDYVKAMEWYQKSAAQNHAAAQINIGYMYRHGLGVKQDYAKAAEWFEKAALNKNESAQFNLGLMYLNGLGVPQSNEKAIEWLKKAAEQGDEDAKKELEKLSRLPNQQVSESKDRER
ncbi:MAG: toll/interleukin-1 receptor domain-containing protein [Synergistaceae bacterium]|nr:toll/interleukin-1 receptor domain-containing protein [Synergistaceae bacterium]